jgi:hypothetical protein
LKTFLVLLIALHGAIHILGFFKAFNLANVDQLTQNISGIKGILWLVSLILFLAAASLRFIDNQYWWVTAALAVLLSQYLILASWHDAKYGTILNAVILIAVIAGYGAWNFRNTFVKEVKIGLGRITTTDDQILSETDILNLPEPIKKYIRYTGSIGKPRVRNFKVEFSGQLRKDEQSDWMPFNSEQFNFLDSTTRLFFLNATMKNLPVAGFHCYKNGDAFMDIRLFSLIEVQYQSGREMDTAETVTFFNDMCCMAPATLIDKRITWLETDGDKVRASFTANNITITAWLYFNEKGELTNFESNDRYVVSANNTMERTPWATPLKNYRDIDGFRLAGYADVIYHYPEGDLCYGNFKLTNIEYNCKVLE